MSKEKSILRYERRHTIAGYFIEVPENEISVLSEGLQFVCFLKGNSKILKGNRNYENAGYYILEKLADADKVRIILSEAIK